MKHGIFIWMVGVISVAAAMPVEAADDGWYGELDVGQADYTKAQFIVEGVTNNTNWNNKYETRVSGGRVLATYKFNRYWGIEGGFVAFDQSSGEAKCVSNKHNTCDPNFDSAGAYQLDASGLQGDVIADFPFSDDWSVFGRAGLTVETTELSEEQNTGLFGSISETNTSVVSTFGFGIGWTVAENWQVRLGWDRYLALGNPDRKPNFDISLISIGLQYHFPD